MSNVSTMKMTARQFMQLGEDPPGVRLELVDGEIAVSPSPNPSHSYVDRKLTIVLGTYIDEHDLGQLYGDVDTIFGTNDVRRPDLIFFRADRIHLVGEQAMEGPPDLCIEIISPSSTSIDRNDKFEQYEAGGVAHYWIVDPKARTVEGYKLVNGKYAPSGRGAGSESIALSPFEGLTIQLGRLWKPRTA